MKCESQSLAQANVAKLAKLFPSVITETRSADGKLKNAVNFEALRQLLSGEMPERDEVYEFTWVGKRAALQEAELPSRKTLCPCPGESKNWDNTENLYIEGDNLDVLKLLQNSYLGMIKMIYIDPPYNTGNDFIYRDNFAIRRCKYKEQTSKITESANSQNQSFFRRTDANDRFHSGWCSMIYPRLMLARNLLNEEGVIFISCDDHEASRLRNICDEIFGQCNFVSQLVWKSKSGGANDSRNFAIDHEYILCYAKNINKFHIQIDTEATVSTNYNRSDENGFYALDRLDKQSIRYSPSLDYAITGPDGKKYYPHHKDPAHPNATWRWSKQTVEKRFSELVFYNGNIYTKNYKKEGSIPRSLLTEERFGRTRTGKTENYELFHAHLFSNPKPTKLIRYLAKITTGRTDTVLDFFSGSATTAHAIMQLNAEDGGRRKFILVQLPEECPTETSAAKAGYKNLCEIGKERIRRAGEKIKTENSDKPGIGGLDIGFRVLKCEPRNTVNW